MIGSSAQTPAEQTPAEQTPAEQTPAEQTPAEQTPAEQTPAEQTPADEPRWLDDEQQLAWRAFNGAVVKLRWAMECQLQRDAGLSFLEYHCLARLSENPGNTLRMSELAEVTDASLSRLSHLVKRLELRDLVRREPDPADGRYTNAILTEAGLRLLVASAPAHVAKVRELVIDALSPDELRHLRTASERILERLEAGGQ